MSLKELTTKATLVFDAEASQALTNWIFYPSIMPKAMLLSSLLVSEDGSHSEINLARALIGLQKDPHLVGSTKFQYIVALLAICAEAILSKNFSRARDAINSVIPFDDRGAPAFAKQCQQLLKEAKVFIDVADLKEALAKEQHALENTIVNWAKAKNTLFTTKKRMQADFMPTPNPVLGLRGG